MESKKKQISSTFVKCFDHLLKVWSAFRLSVDMHPEVCYRYGSIETEEGDYQDILEIDLAIGDLKYEVFQHCKDYSVNEMDKIERVSDLFFEFMMNFFEVEVGDKSDEQIAKQLCFLYRELEDGKTELRDAILDLKENEKYEIEYPVPQKQEKVVEKPPKLKEIDEDGFEDVVVKK